MTAYDARAKIPETVIDNFVDRHMPAAAQAAIANK